jgi:flagellar motor switch protein FliN
MSDTNNETDLNLKEIADPSAGKVENPYAYGEAMAGDVTAIYDIPVQISAVLGRSTMQVSQLLKLGRGAVVELDRKVGEAIDIYVNNRLVARGEVVVVEDKLGVTMTEIVKSDRS